MARDRVVMDDDGMARVRLRITQHTQAITDDMFYDIRAATPVDTGDLLASERVSYPAWNRGRIKIGTDHWIYPEFGTRFMAAEPYIRPAVFRSRWVNA
jgi:hypothetical protein